ncbi:S8 family serine peptidase [Micromonospora sp. NPDC049580]|uniref:S8 family serine peptidase n=1 Tax=Micromonospora sp. NPDC049580 TaxID=3154832 RepID=UPI003448A44B
MIRRRNVAAALLAGTIAAVLGATTPAGAEAAPAPAQKGSRASESVSITLITGDRVVVSAQGGTAIERAPGRAGVRFVNQTSEGHRLVIPVDALPLLRQGRLDKRLFDLTALTEFGYTGDRDLPLLLSYEKSANARAAVDASARVSRDISGLGMLAVRASRAKKADLWNSLTRGAATDRSLSPGVDKVWLDGKRTLALDTAVAQVGVPAAWQQGLDGTGVTVAVLDSGIDAGHPDFAGRIVANENFLEGSAADDIDGHGTHVASIIAGSGAASGGKYRGVAPGAKLAVGKVCEGNYCDESAILAGMQWAAQKAPVVNMSLSGPDSPEVDPLEQAVEDLTAAYGPLFVLSAGNQGLLGSRTIGSPAAADSGLAVGAVDDQDHLAGFSSRGPRLGDGAIKPDITAPGVGIVAARAAAGHAGAPVSDRYTSLSGTSMATPMVAGAAAIVTQQHPGWSSRQRKTLLMGAAQPGEGIDVFAQGAGRLDVARAVRQTISVDEGSVSFGEQEWPHTDDTPVTKTLTYRNGGTTPVTLTVAVDGDADTFTVAATSLTVPAGGTATTTVTSDTRGEGPDGIRSARVVATAPGDVRVETPTAVEREVESYDVTFRHLGRDGLLNLNYWDLLIGLDTPQSYQLYDGEEAQTVRLPKGRYGLIGNVYGETDTTMLVQTSFVADTTRTVTLDARQAGPVTIRVPRADARQATAKVDAYWTGRNAGFTTESVVPGDLHVGQIGPATAVTGFQSSISSVFARWKNDAEGFLDSPYTYETSYTRQGVFYTGFDKQVTAAELATVKAHYAREADGATGAKYNWPVVGTVSGGTVGLPFSLPFERTEYLGTQGGVQWSTTFEQQVQTDPEYGPERVTQTAGPAQAFTAGRVYQQDWNRAVFAPLDPGVADGDLDTVFRKGDTIEASIPLFGEGAGHWGQRYLTDSARTALYAGGVLIGETTSLDGEFAVPAERRDYRLEMSATSPAPHRLSTAVSGLWTFSSANGDTRLPLSTVRFSPSLDSNNAAPAGTFTVPVTVTPLAGSAATANRTLTAQFSVDDGKTWRSASVSADRRTLRVTNPAAGYLSLRVNATDRTGNTATVTVIRAYAVK